MSRGLATFVEVGRALATIRDSRLYREDFATFEDYCDQRWQLERAHAYRLIDSARVVELISSPMGDEITTIPATERQARELAPLLDDPEELREVWTGGRTAHRGQAQRRRDPHRAAGTGRGRAAAVHTGRPGEPRGADERRPA